MALGTPEHGGRVRAGGPYAKITNYFAAERKSSRASKSEVQALRKEVEELKALFMSGGVMQRPTDHDVAPCPPVVTQSASASCSIAEQPTCGPTAIPAKKQKERPCLLVAHGSSEIVAKGKVLEELGQGFLKVMVTIAYVNNALVPCPTAEVETVYDAVSNKVKWPSHMVSFDMEVCTVYLTFIDLIPVLDY